MTIGRAIRPSCWQAEAKATARSIRITAIIGMIAVSLESGVKAGLAEEIP